MSMQFSRFAGGGFVLHRIELPGMSGRYSAWFATDATLVDAEHHCGGGVVRDVRSAGIKEKLQAVGRQYRHVGLAPGQPTYGTV
jgi:hypothetical protein